MRVVVVVSNEIVNAVYRGMLLVGLSRLGHEVTLDVGGRAFRAGRVRGADVVHIHRFSEREMRKAAEAHLEQGVAIVWDNDDDLGGSALKARGAMLAQQSRAGIPGMLRTADLVTTTSSTLAEQYRSAGARDVHVVGNYLPDTYAAQPSPRRDELVIGWIGAGEHYHDAEQLGMTETLRRLLAAHPDLRVETVGLDLRLPAERASFRIFVPYEELAQHAARFDIGLAPIVDIPFNRARSDVKLKEYAAVGVPWLASPIGPYSGYGERHGGRLVADDRWYQELDELLGNERLRRKLAKRAARWGDSQRARRNMKLWEAPLLRAVELARARTAG